VNVLPKTGVNDTVVSMGAGELPAASAGTVHAVAADAFRRWLDGDREAMRTLVNVMNPRLWHVVRAYRLDEATAKDVVQETWARFVRRSTAIDDPQAVAAWLTVTARREAWRAVGRRERDEPADAEILETRLKPGPSAEDDVVRRISDDALWRSVRTLPERCQRLLRIIAFDDKPDYRRIAEETGMRIGSIGPTRSRCLDRLRVALSAEGIR
jgi:RNA polymerase sigma factor (sigma-70 family)